MVPRLFVGVEPSQHVPGAAIAGMAVAANIITAIRAAITNKLMRLITLYPFCTASTLRLALKLCQVGCEFAGAGRIVCASTRASSV